MKRQLFRSLIIGTVLSISACTGGIHGGIVSSWSDDASTPHQSPQIYWPRYSVSQIEFSDVIVSISLPEGWSVDHVEDRIVLSNEEKLAGILIVSSSDPALELLRQYYRARDDGLNVSALTIGNDGDVTSYFSYFLSEENAGAMIGLLTDYRDISSGVLLVGSWPIEQADQLFVQMHYIAQNLIITRIARSCGS